MSWVSVGSEAPFVCIFYFESQICGRHLDWRGRDNHGLSGHPTQIPTLSNPCSHLPHQWGERAKGSDMPQRIKKLNINVLDFLPGMTTGQKLDSTPSSTNNGRTLPLDIASSILFHVTDFSSLKCLMLVNKCFFEAFQTSRTSLMTAVAVNMFGESLDWALVLAQILSRSGTGSIYPNQTIELKSPSPITLASSKVLKKAQFIYHVINKWIELYKIKHLWLNATETGSEASRERERFVRALILHWVCVYCASPFAMRTIGKSDILGYFSNFELSETLAIVSFFQDVLSRVSEECELEGDDRFMYWPTYCFSREPDWLLRLLDNYTAALAGTDASRLDTYSMYPAYTEWRKRHLAFDYEGEAHAHLTDTGHASLALEFTGKGTSGDFRRISMKQATLAGHDA
ncbi:hypothetical protein M408DRAFT_305183 [Serendipita vermifera MAFF 305830]|uniref:Uncharacterized protein n=1 Tax=Serendipita vermifera MAFF 305830 TaxID=933852 RepID=A0A0C2WUQ5_SERVB|nr:hypothetical protein M408DRAFT_305183 [Serendipita vermifera MAFF 305830]